MKKVLLVALGFMIAVSVFGAAGFAYAQNLTPPAPEYPYGSGMMGNYDGFGRGYGYGMMGGYGRGYGHGMMGWNGEYGPMHEAMVTTIANALAISPEEIESRHNAGETMWQIAESEGLSAEEIQALMFSTHDFALEDAVANGWMTEEQAEWMDAHMDQMWSGDYRNGAFGGHCGGRGWNANSRWQGEN